MTEVTVAETKYTQSHEWVRIEDGIATIGVTAFAQKELGDVVYVELPEVGATVNAGDEAAVLESTKAAADVYAPVSGEIADINTELETTPDKVNDSPEADGWLFRVKMATPDEQGSLLDETQYKELTQ